MTLQNKHILISGAGIAGPILAYWLKRYGFTPVVVERAPKLREGGYAIDIRIPAMEIAKRMGLWSLIEQAETHMQNLAFIDKYGKSLASLHIPDLYNGMRSVEVMREDLGKMAYELTHNEVEYIFGNSIQTLQEDAEGIRVTFERGDPRHFDLIVGADGLHSVVRRLAFGDEYLFEKYIGYQVAVFTLDNYLGLDYTAQLYNVPGKAIGVYSAHHNQKLVTIFAFRSKEKPAFDYHDIQQQQQMLRDAFAGVQWRCTELLEKMPTAPDFYFDVVSQIHMPRWSQGRVVLLGDAGYCPSLLTGQGTTLAMTGAYILAGELKAANGDYQHAFQMYESTFRDFVQREQRKTGFGIRFLAPENPLTLWTRNQFSRVLGRFVPLLVSSIWQPPKPSDALKDYEDAGVLIER